MNTRRRILVLFALFGIVMWFLDTSLDYYFFYRPHTFWDLLILNVPQHEWYIRSCIVAFFMIAGWIIGNVVEKQKQAEEELRESRDQLEVRVAQRTARIQSICEKLKKQIIDRKAAERICREHEERLEQMFEQSLAVMLLIDEETGDIVDANPAASLFYGYPPEVLKSMKIWHINTLPEAETRDKMCQALSNRRDHFLFRHRLASGVIRDVEAYVCRVDLNGREMLYSIIHDVTERRQAEEALKESEERYRMLFNNANDAILVIDTTGEPSNGSLFTEVNEVACQQLGYSREELLRMTPEDLAPPHQTQRIAELRARIAEDKYMVFEQTALHKDGRLIPFEVSTHRFDFKERTIILSIARNITERKRIEEALKNTGEQLRLLSSQLLTTQEKERALIARDLHDSIGQTLSAIKFSLENALAQTTLEADCPGLQSLKNLVPTVQNAVEEVRRICSDLRPPLLDDFGAVATLRWFCREFQHTFPHIRIAQELDIEEEVIPETLKTVIFRVTQEAIHNISKHSRADRVHLTLKKTDNAIELSIRDNGVGFDLEQPTAGSSEPRGMGLASMRERTELVAGRFLITSARSEGTVVRATWPLSEDIDR